MLVSGVRSSWEASATNSRCFFIAASRSARAASSERSICSSVRASSPTSSSIFGSGMWREGSPVSAISRALAVSEETGRIARAGDRQAGEAGEQGAAEDAGGDEEPEPVDRRVDVLEAAPVLDVAGRRAAFVADFGGRHAVALVGREAGWDGAEVGRRRLLCSIRLPLEVVDARGGVVGADEVVEAGALRRRSPSGV